MIPLVEAGLTLEPVVVNLIKSVIGIFHHAKVPAAPGAPATAAGTVPLTPDQAKAMSAAAAATVQSVLTQAVANGLIPASSVPDEKLIPALTQLIYSLLPSTAAVETTATINTLAGFLQQYEVVSAAFKAAK